MDKQNIKENLSEQQQKDASNLNSTQQQQQQKVKSIANQIVEVSCLADQIQQRSKSESNQFLDTRSTLNRTNLAYSSYFPIPETNNIEIPKKKTSNYNIPKQRESNSIKKSNHDNSKRLNRLRKRFKAKKMPLVFKETPK